MKEFIANFPIFFIGIMTIVGFVAMGLDKFFAVKGMWRIPEKTLFLLCALGGGVGTIAGIYAFRHKTRKKIFTWGMPLILIVEIAIIVYVKFFMGQ